MVTTDPPTTDPLFQLIDVARIIAIYIKNENTPSNDKNKHSRLEINENYSEMKKKPIAVSYYRHNLMPSSSSRAVVRNDIRLWGTQKLPFPPFKQYTHEREHSCAVYRH